MKDVAFGVALGAIAALGGVVLGARLAAPVPGAGLAGMAAQLPPQVLERMLARERGGPAGQRMGPPTGMGGPGSGMPPAAPGGGGEPGRGGPREPSGMPGGPPEGGTAGMADGMPAGMGDQRARPGGGAAGPGPRRRARRPGEPLTYDGFIQPAQVMLAGTAVPGQIARVCVREGQRVRAGAALFELEHLEATRRLIEAQAAAKAARARAKASVEIAAQPGLTPRPPSLASHSTPTPREGGAAFGGPVADATEDRRGPQAPFPALRPRATPREGGAAFGDPVADATEDRRGPPAPFPALRPRATPREGGAAFGGPVADATEDRRGPPAPFPGLRPRATPREGGAAVGGLAADAPGRTGRTPAGRPGPPTPVQDPETQVKLADLDVQRARQAIAQAIVRAPISGVVQALPSSGDGPRRGREAGSTLLGDAMLPRAGTQAAPNTPLCAIVAGGKPEITFDVDELEIGRVYGGQVVVIQPKAFPEQKLTGCVTRIGAPGLPRAGAAAFPVTVQVLSPLRRVRVGMSVQVTLQ